MSHASVYIPVSSSTHHKLEVLGQQPRNSQELHATLKLSQGHLPVRTQQGPIQTEAWLCQCKAQDAVL